MFDEISGPARIQTGIKVIGGAQQRKRAMQEQKSASSIEVC